MGREQTAEYYDGRLDRVSLPYEDSPWKPIYDRVVEVLLETKIGKGVLDVGCGTGRCAEAIRRAGISSYLGVDFSPARIEEARSYVPEFRFAVGDVFSEEISELFERYDVFVMTEFLEHIERDRDVIARIPSGSVVALSVPNFDSAGHVRCFADESDVIKRYEEFIDFWHDKSTSIRKPQKNNKITWILFGGRR